MKRINTLEEPPEDPYSEEGWEECPRCKGAGVEMAARQFEVYFRFSDEVQARDFMDRATSDGLGMRGIRVVAPDDDWPPKNVALAVRRLAALIDVQQQEGHHRERDGGCRLERVGHVLARRFLKELGERIYDL